MVARPLPRPDEPALSNDSPPPLDIFTPDSLGTTVPSCVISAPVRLFVSTRVRFLVVVSSPGGLRSRFRELDPSAMVGSGRTLELRRPCCWRSPSSPSVIDATEAVRDLE